MPEMQGEGGEFRFTIEVTRAVTGETETYELIGKVAADDADTLDDRA